jgi:hypothetical protein
VGSLSFARAALALLVLSLLSAGCNLCRPRGGGLQQCPSVEVDDDDAGDDDAADDDDAVDDDDAGDDDAGDDDDVLGDECLARRTRPGSFDAVATFGYGWVTTDSAALPFCWFDVDVVDQEAQDLHSAGATAEHTRIEWDVIWYGEIAPTVRLDINGTLNFAYQSSHNPNNSCDFQSWDEPSVAAFWDDLNMTADGAGALRFGVTGEIGDRIAISWWDAVYHDDFRGDPISFQILLFEADHHVEVHYLDVEAGEWDVDYGRGATIGLHSEGAALVGCNERTLRNNFTIAYWPPE